MWSWLKNLFKRKEKKGTVVLLPVEKDQLNYESQLKAYRIALKELGVREVDGKEANPRIVEYHRATSGKFSSDEVPWCSSFVNWCMDEAQLPKTNSAMARSWLNWGYEPLNAREGDLVILSRGSNGQGHVAFVHRINALTVEACGGNQSNAVCIQSYPKFKVLGFRRVR